jgi:hypothetical protein
MSMLPIRRRLVVVWLLFAVLLAGIIAHEITDIFEPEPPRTGRMPMFGFRERELGRVDVIHQGQTATLMRDTAGAWLHRGAHRLHSHADTHAADPTSSTAIAERLELMARMLTDRRVQPEQSLDHYGLTNPQTMIAFYGRTGVDHSQPLAMLYVGDLLPTQYAYYTMRPGDRELSLIPRYYIALLLALAFGEDQAPTPLPMQGGKG